MWDELAPHWELFEQGNFNLAVLDSYLGEIRDPVLLIGAGQGLVTQPMRSRGLKVFGIDASRKMVERGVRRRGEPNIVADARELPFKARSFETVLFATGTLDFMFHEDDRMNALREARRVLSRDRGIVINLTRPLEEVFLGPAEALGIIDGAVIHAERGFALWRAGQDPARWADLIKRWKKLDDAGARSLVRENLAILAYLVRELDRSNRPVIEHCRKLGTDPMKILEVSLSPLPFWTEERLSSLLREAGLTDFDIRTLPQVYVVFC